MGKKLVIVESPAKAKTINKILGSDFIVRASMGHVRDLPVKALGVDIEKNFEPTYVSVKGRSKVLTDLKKDAAGCDEIYLAPDPDREGEAIAWHLREALSTGAGRKKPFFRIQYNEVTPRAVKAAFENPGQLDMNRVNSQQARRILDRIVGYKVSPVLWRQVRRGLSAGRVQSVALRLVCEREARIRDFKTEEYWVLGAKVRKLIEPLIPFTIRLAKVNGEKVEIKDAQKAHAIKTDLDGRQLAVQGVDLRDVTRHAMPPFITSTLQQAGSSFCGFSPSRTMSIAQKLYEGVDLGDGPVGLITYMRTDSFALSQESVAQCRKFISDKFGEKYCPEKPNAYRSRSSAQGAHEAIRPTDVTRLPESLAGVLDASELRLYKLIWQRFVACQMTSAILSLRSVKIQTLPDAARPGDYLFLANASEVKFDGYMKITGAELEGGKQEEVVPPVTVDEKLECLEWLEERKETQPPARYSEASLIKALESNGIGRPSTYASIMYTLISREYVKKDKRSLVPTELGEKVCAFLVANLNELFDVGFTAAMEESLDKVEEGKVEWTAMLGEFYGRFSEWVGAVSQGGTADPGAVSAVLGAMEKVTEWRAQSERFSDEKFVKSLGKQITAGKKTTQRQLDTLIRIATRYREQVPDLDEVVEKTGHAHLLNDESSQPASEDTWKKLNALQATPMTPSADKFVKSLRARAEGGRSLSEAQARALDSIIRSHAVVMPDFESIKGLLQGDIPTGQKDEEIEKFIQAIAKVKQWKEPVKRGKRVFDDSAFAQSLTEQFGRKGSLSPKQVGALKKLIKRYKEQIPEHEALIGSEPKAEEPKDADGKHE
jgi:DNA topoisomerase I